MGNIDTILITPENRINKLFYNDTNATYVWRKVQGDFILDDYHKAPYKENSEEIKKYLGIKASEFYQATPDIINDLKRCWEEQIEFSKEQSNVDKRTESENFKFIRYKSITTDLVLVYVDDIIDKKQLEQNARESVKDLEKINIILIQKAEERIKELKKSVEIYRYKYEITKFYRGFFTHDINNILNNILMSSELSTITLNKNGDHDKIREFLNIIIGEVGRGVSLISNFLKHSEFDEKKMTLQPTELCKTLNDSISSVKKVFQDRNMNIDVKSYDTKIFVKANNLLKEVFCHVLNNALKYNEKKSVDIFIRISKEQKKEQDFIKMEFIDNGIGIPDTHKEFIFKKGHKEHKSGKGMGFGLTIVSRIIDSYNGKVWVEDRVKGDFTKGINFVLLIPRVE